MFLPSRPRLHCPQVRKADPGWLVAVAGFGEGLSFGAGATFEPVWLVYNEKATGDTVTFSWKQLAGGVFVVLTYVQIGAGYALAIGDINMKVTIGGSVVLDMDETFSIGLVHVMALGKYPFALGSLVFFPAVGVEYSICLSGNIAGTDFDSEDRKDFTDLFALGGAGIDIAVSRNVYVRILGLFGLQLDRQTVHRC